ncbi:MAG TPA: F0F1 ATP synthase subunit A, partial [Tepidisphaeraceae bacterium]|nr:F0F1 ATP synthase subunit A [Tepidisphaeraceae bacterium]
GTYGHHGHHEEHSSNGNPGHEAAHDLEHMRGEALAGDVPQNVDALQNPGKHYADDEHYKHHHQQADNGHLHGDDHGHGKKWNPVAALLAAPFLYLWNFAPHPFKPNMFLDVPMWAFLLVLELIGAGIKPFALMIRLFANMIAGHIVLAALVALIVVMPSVLAQIGVGIPVIALSLLIRLLELFVAFLQTYIFVFLTTLFIASAIAPEH